MTALIVDPAIHDYTRTLRISPSTDPSSINDSRIVIASHSSSNSHSWRRQAWQASKAEQLAGKRVQKPVFDSYQYG